MIPPMHPIIAGPSSRATKPRKLYTTKCRPNKSELPYPPVVDREYVVSATFPDSPPATAVLIAPSKAVYTIKIPDLKPKDDKPQPLQVGQNDAAWIAVPLKPVIKAEDRGKSLTVEANNVQLPYKLADADKKTGETKSLQVELTRAITEKAGLVEVTVTNSDKKAIGMQKVQVTCSQ